MFEGANYPTVFL